MDEILDIGSTPGRTYNQGLTPLHPPYKQVIRIQAALFCLPLGIAAIVADLALAGEAMIATGSIMLPVFALLAFVIVFLPGRRYRRWGYDMGAERLRVLRGFLFRTDTIVPFNRIQHIDVAQGPVERIFGVSTLVVHTAGTHNSTVSLPGVESATASAMRDTMREHIRREMV